MTDRYRPVSTPEVPPITDNSEGNERETTRGRGGRREQKGEGK